MQCRANINKIEIEKIFIKAIKRDDIRFSFCKDTIMEVV